MKSRQGGAEMMALGLYVSTGRRPGNGNNGDEFRKGDGTEPGKERGIVWKFM